MWQENTDLSELIHHSDRGSQYLSLAYTDRLTELGIAPWLGSRGDSYDNALAEAVNAAYKTELVYRGKPWRTVAEVELATARWVAWYNQERLHEALGYVPPAEYEAALTGTSHPASSQPRPSHPNRNKTKVVENAPPTVIYPTEQCINNTRGRKSTATAPNSLRTRQELGSLESLEVRRGCAPGRATSYEMSGPLAVSPLQFRP